MVCKNWNIRTVYNVSQHYINDASLMCIAAECTDVYPKNMALGQVVTKIVGHVDTVWETKQVYARISLKSKICNYSWSKSLELIKRQPKKFSFFRNYDLVTN